MNNGDQCGDTHGLSHTHQEKKQKNNLPVTTKSATEQRENLQLRGHSIPIVHFLLSLSLSLSLSLHHSLPLPFSPPPFLRPSLTNTFIMTWHLYNNLLFSLQRSSTPEIWSVGFMLRSFHSFCQSDNFFFFFGWSPSGSESWMCLPPNQARAGFPKGKTTPKNTSVLFNRGDVNTVFLLWNLKHIRDT